MQKFALVLRSSINNSTEVSPALLNLGREIQLPIDRALQADSCQNFEIERENLRKLIPESLHDIILKVKDNIIKAHQVNKVYFDAKRRDVSFKVGEKVLVRNNELSNAEQNKAQKFCKKWIGPFTIIKNYDNTYILDMPKRMIPKRHVSDLKPFFDRNLDFSSPVSDSNNSVNVSQIPVQKRLRNNPKFCYKKFFTSRKN